MSMRMRRLHADAEQMRRAFDAFTPIHILSAVGEPPEKYVVEFRVRSLIRGPGREPVIADRHVAEIQLTLEYPRQSPKCKMLTPVFHPNIEPAVICVGDHWTAGERLVDLVVRIGEMLTYQAYNIKSPLDGEAAKWADLNRARLPIDPRSVRPPDLE
jgi:ubiquitin-protein ligase